MLHGLAQMAVAVEQLVIAVTIHIHIVIVVMVAAAAQLANIIVQLTVMAVAVALELLPKEQTAQADQTEFQDAEDPEAKTGDTENHIVTVLVTDTAKVVATAVLAAVAAHRTVVVGAEQERLELFGVQAEATLMLQVNLI